MVTRFLSLIAVVSLAACTFPEAPLPPGEHRVVVHAILDPQTNIQTIQLSTTYGSGAADLDSATVIVTAPDGQQIVYHEDSAATFNGSLRQPLYKANVLDPSLSLVPGGTYTLLIVTRSGETITGTTTIPNALPARMEIDTTGFFRHVDTLRLSWPEVPGARGYEVQVWAASPCGTRCGSRSSLTQSVFTTGPFTLAGMSQTLGGDPVFPQNALMSVAVLAVDLNYREYYRDLSDPFAGAAPSRLTGGLGVFGSVVPVVLKRFEVR